MQTQQLQLDRLVDDPEICKAAAKSLKGFCLTYLPPLPARSIRLLRRDVPRP
jgi:hypothetical protein